jgi:hypothetical protein
MDQESELSRSNTLAKAELVAMLGEPTVAISSLGEILDRSWSALQADHTLFARALAVVIAASDFDTAAAMTNRRWETGDWFGIGVEHNNHPRRDVIRWEIQNEAHSKLWFDKRLLQSGAMEPMIVRLVSVLPLLASYRTYDRFSAGSLFVNLGDIGYVPGLAFCDSRPEYFLIPDALFVVSRGYASMRRQGRAETVSWDRRQPLGFWRGGTSGRATDVALGWRSLPRVALCEISREHPEILDAGITHVGQMPDAESEHELRITGIMRSVVPAAEFENYKYQIDIDGNTNSWPGLFQKLLTGSPVLKVGSLYGYRQWYYDRLRPWVNFVPVSGDMSDLLEKISWLRQHDDAARRIGENGMALAMSLTYEEELQAAGRTIAAAARFFAGQPETDIQFGPEIPDDVRLLSGWTTSRRDGLTAVGQESRLELPQPVAAEDFVLTLDLSPYNEAPASPAQRVGIEVNGETLSDTVLSSRQLVRCRVSRRTIGTANCLSVTLRHPDASSLASASNPLDDRALSIVVNRLTLTPTSVYATTRPAATEMRRLDLVGPNSGRFLEENYGPDLWPPLAVKLGQVKTYWDTVIFADLETGALRHGPEIGSPNNVILAEDDGTTYLFRMIPDGHSYAMRITAERRGTGETPIPDGSRAFRMRAVAGGERFVFGLQNGGLLLCAEADGRVTLSRSALGPWERFKLSARGETSGPGGLAITDEEAL